tara:strand:+ start:105 stop:875 length:771 start_codon:yes stop_codon:yes gene_type:complete
MKSLIKRLLNTDFSIYLRNSLNISPVHMNIDKLKCATVSDAFAWRTDNNFTTKFKYSDILNIFYKVKDSWVEIHFYTKKNELIKIQKIDELKISNEIDITPEFLNNIRDYGTFYIYHFSNETINNENIISNRCYLGYSQHKNLFSFVHGNTLAKFKNISGDKKNNIDVIKTSFFKNHTYKVQKYFDGYDVSELFFSNPTSKVVNFTIDNQNHRLDKGCSKLIDISHKKVISIRSNCLFLRPTIFTYKDKYLDVHHA